MGRPVCSKAHQGECWCDIPEKEEKSQGSEPQREVRIEPTRRVSALPTVASLLFTNLAEIQVGVEAYSGAEPKRQEKALSS